MKAHVSRILGKFNCTNRVQLVLLYHGILQEVHCNTSREEP